jgi:hypothetical protein
MAFENPSDAQPGAFENAPFQDGLQGIIGASGLEAALRTEQGRNRPLVKPDGEYENLFDEFVHVSVLLFGKLKLHGFHTFSFFEKKITLLFIGSQHADDILLIVVKIHQDIIFDSEVF